MKNGRKYGVRSLIEEIFLMIKKYVLLICLIIIFIFWVYYNISSSSEMLEPNKVANDVEELSGSNEIKGIAKAIDGDSILLARHYEVRLENIDAPEFSQKCLDKNNYEYACGQMSFNFLRKLVDNLEVTCRYQKKDIYKRFLGICYLGDKNINNELIKNGMAITYSFSRINNSLKLIENEAKSNNLGIWQGSFLEPKKYRKKHKFNN